MSLVYFHANLSIGLTTSTNKIQKKVKWHFEASLSMKVSQNIFENLSLGLCYRTLQSCLDLSELPCNLIFFKKAKYLHSYLLHYFIPVENNIHGKTILWSIIKQKWLVGPKLPNNYDIYGGCAVPIDRSVVIIMRILGFRTGNEHANSENNVFSFNFESNEWTKLKNFPKFSNVGIEHPDMSCSCAFEKSNKT